MQRPEKFYAISRGEACKRIGNTGSTTQKLYVRKNNGKTFHHLNCFWCSRVEFLEGHLLFNHHDFTDMHSEIIRHWHSGVPQSSHCSCSDTLSGKLSSPSTLFTSSPIWLLYINTCVAFILWQWLLSCLLLLSLITFNDLRNSWLGSIFHFLQVKW